MPESDVRDVSLVAVTSHEMRAPLAAIRGFVDLLQRRRAELSEAEVEEFLRVISVQTDRLVRLADDLVTMESLDDDTLTVSHESIMVVPAVEQLVRELPGGERIELRVSADAPPSVETDVIRFAQVFSNLLTNALKYSERDAAVTLALEAAPARRILISVIDRGIGIREDELQRVFEPFYRTVEGARAAEGTGLGLTITRRLVEALGGTIGAERTPGGGTTFRVTLPVRASPAR
jgi:signal transduction histidine kinase